MRAILSFLAALALVLWLGTLFVLDAIWNLVKPDKSYRRNQDAFGRNI